jgi:transcriptional regulator with XRE-family HTH domain
MIGRAIYLLRQARGLSRQQLAELSGVPREVIFQIEIGRTRTPHLRTMEKLANGFGVSLARIFNEQEILFEDPLIRSLAPLVPSLTIHQRLEILRTLRAIGAPAWLRCGTEGTWGVS